MAEVTERISAKLGHIFTYDFYLKNLVQTPPGIYHPPLPPRAGGQKNDRLWSNIPLQWNVISTVGKKLVNLQGLHYMPPTLAYHIVSSAWYGGVFWDRIISRYFVQYSIISIVFPHSYIMPSLFTMILFLKLPLWIEVNLTFKFPKVVWQHM